MILRKKDIPILLNRYYPDIKDIIAVKELNSTSINSKNFVIITKKEKFVLKQFLGNISTITMEKICEITYHCRKKNIKISEPVYNIKKKFVIKKFRSYLLKYYEGKECSCNNNEIIDLAKNLALLHKELGKISNKYKFSTDRSKYRILTSNEILSIKKKIKRKQNLDTIDRKVMRKLDFIEECRNKIPSKFVSKQQLIHSDLIPSNIVFKNNQLTSIIDIDSLRIGNVRDDIVQCSFRFIIKNTKNTKILLKMPQSFDFAKKNI